MQPAPAAGGAVKAAFERLQRRIAKDGADRGVIMLPSLLDGRLEPGIRHRRRDAPLSRLPIFGVERRRYRAIGRRIDFVTQRLKLNALQPVRHLVHLKEHCDRHAAERVALQHNISVAVAKIERLRQPPRRRPELPHQRVRRLAPMDVAQQRRKTLRRRSRPRQHHGQGCRNPRQTANRRQRSSSVQVQAARPGQISRSDASSLDSRKGR
jgi:hypothetical protein